MTTTSLASSDELFMPLPGAWRFYWELDVTKLLLKV